MGCASEPTARSSGQTRRRAARARASAPGATPAALLLGLVLLLLGGCAMPLRDVPRPASFAVDRPLESFLGTTLATTQMYASGTSAFRLLVLGEEAFLARAVLAQTAERTLDLQYYMVADDATARTLMFVALRAAQRGVRVRILLDDLYAVGRDDQLARLAAQPNVELRVVNPFNHRGGLLVGQLADLLGNPRLNQRMHNKVWIADNVAAVVGGRNLGDHYFAARDDGDFGDLDVLAAGPVVGALSASFDSFWNSEVAVPVGALAEFVPATGEVSAAADSMAAEAQRFRDGDYAERLRRLDLGRLLRSGQLAMETLAPASVAFDAPDKFLDRAVQPNPILAAMRAPLDAARSELIIVTPYLIPGERGVASMCALQRRGVRVRVLTNSLATTDVPVVHAGYARDRPRLVACGVELHELRRRAGQGPVARVGFSSGASLHAKAVAVDRSTVLVGSMNLDPRSRDLNSEISVLIDSPVLGARIARMFEEATAPDQAFRVRLATPGDPASALVWEGTEAGRPVSHDSEPLAGWWRRVLSRVLGAITPAALL